MADWARNLLVTLFATLLALGVAEMVLTVLDIPGPSLEPHSHPPQFRFVPGADFGYLNRPSSAIEFVYDGNTRGYFGPRNEVIHRTNKMGFRGDDFAHDKPPGVYRIAFLGDSFTFGEGVHADDIYPGRIKTLLAAAGQDVEVMNFGVGGYNSRQEAALMRALVWQSDPDLVVIGFTINDAEPPLFYYDESRKRFRRRLREQDVGDGSAMPTPPDRAIYDLRLARLVWQFFVYRERTASTIGRYRALYAPDNPDWIATQAALADIASQCAEADVPCAVILFPLLHQLGRYPLQDEHDKIKGVLQRNDFLVIDLLPELRGMDAATLWVHPTDHHPNEIVHGIAAQATVTGLRNAGVFH